MLLLHASLPSSQALWLSLWQLADSSSQPVWLALRNSTCIVQYCLVFSPEIVPPRPSAYHSHMFLSMLLLYRYASLYVDSFLVFTSKGVPGQPDDRDSDGDSFVSEWVAETMLISTLLSVVLCLESTSSYHSNPSLLCFISSQNKRRASPYIVKMDQEERLEFMPIFTRGTDKSDYWRE